MSWRCWLLKLTLIMLIIPWQEWVQLRNSEVFAAACFFLTSPSELSVWNWVIQCLVCSLMGSTLLQVSPKHQTNGTLTQLSAITWLFCSLGCQTPSPNWQECAGIISLVVAKGKVRFLSNVNKSIYVVTGGRGKFPLFLNPQLDWKIKFPFAFSPQASLMCLTCLAAPLSLAGAPCPKAGWALGHTAAALSGMALSSLHAWAPWQTENQWLK